MIRDSKGSRVESKEGRPKMVYEKIERPAVPDDVISYRDYGAKLVLVLCDGKKYEVLKNIPKVATSEGSK